MSKHRKIQTHHVYLGAGGLLAIAALVVALTFGLTTHAQTPPPEGNCMYGGTYPNCYPAPTPPPSTTPPPASTPTCPSGQYWNGSMCANSTYTTPPPAQTCASGQYWDGYACVNNTAPASGCGSTMYWNGSMCVSNGTTSTPTCPSGQYWNGSMCATSSTTTGNCSSGQYWNGSICVNSTTTCTQQVPFWCPARNSCTVTQAECSGTSGTTTSGGSYCVSPAVWNGTTCMNGTTQVMPVSCPTGMIYSGMNCVTGTATQPTTTNPNCPIGQHWGRNASTQSDMCVMDGTNLAPGSTMPTYGTMYPCPQAGNAMMTPEACGAATPVCGPGQTPGQNMCRYDTMMPIDQYYQPGSCPSGMLQCTDHLNNKSCYSNQIYDYKTGAMRGASCTDYQTGPTSTATFGNGFGPNFGPNPFFGPTMPNATPLDPCALNPNDPFCRAGFNFDALKSQYQFDENANFNKFQVRNVKQEVTNLKREAKGWCTEAKQIRRQLQDASRESNGFACPQAVEVNAAATEFDNACTVASSLTTESSTEDVQKVLAMRDHINEIRGSLYGHPDFDTGEQVTGLMQGLGICRELSGAISSSCSAAKEVEREYNQLKKGKAPASVIDAFEEVLPKLQARCTNPLAALEEEGISFDDLSEPWQPDPSCAFGGFSGPMPMTSMSGRGEGHPFFGDENSNEDMSACMPPVQRYLGLQDLMRQLEEARFEGQRHFESMNACGMFEKGEKEFTRQSARGSRFAPPEEIGQLLEEGLAACEEGDSELIAELQDEMFKIGRRSFQGRAGRGPLGDLVDIDALVEEKLNEKLKELGLDDENDAGFEALQAQIEELTKNLTDAQKTILALKEDLAQVATQIASFNLSTGATAAFANITQLPNDEVQQAVTATISDVAVKAEAVKSVLPAVADKLVDNTMSALLQAPPSEAVLASINENLTACQSFASSYGEDPTVAEEKLIVAKCTTELAAVITSNNADVGNKVSEGICAGTDACNLSEWYAVPALAAKEQGLINPSLTEVKPADPNTVEMAVVRMARLAGTADIINPVDEPATEREARTESHSGVPGDASWWATASWDAVNERAPILATLDPNAPITREQLATLATEVLGLEVPSDYAQIAISVGVSGNDDHAREIAAMVSSGCMSTTDGTNFSPSQTYNRAQDFKVATCLAEFVAQEGSTADNQ